MDQNEFIQRLPKAEVHLHLEAALPWPLVRQLSSENLPETPEWWADEYRFPDWATFGQAFMISQSTLQSVEDYQRAASAIFENLAAQNVRYLEMSIGSEAVLRKGLHITDVATAVKNAAPQGMTVAFICGFNRGFSYSMDDEVVQAVLNAPIDGIDLHGPETPDSAKPYALIYEAAWERGLITKAHAGEFQGPDSIYDALDILKVKRIEHGTRAFEDDQLIERLITDEITLDMCPISNLKLGVVSDLTTYPLKYFLERGVRVTVNTDDPTLFGNTLTNELHVVVDVMGLSLPIVAELQKNAFRVARLSDEQRLEILAEIDDLVAHLE